MKLIGLNQISSVTQGSSDIFLGYLVLVHDLFFGHAAGQTANDTGNRHSGSPNNWLSMLEFGVNDNPFPYFHCTLSLPLPVAIIARGRSFSQTATNIVGNGNPEDAPPSSGLAGFRTVLTDLELAEVVLRNKGDIRIPSEPIPLADGFINDFREGVEQAEVTTEKHGEIPDDLFDCIIGCDDLSSLHITSRLQLKTLCLTSRLHLTALHSTTSLSGGF